MRQQYAVACGKGPGAVFNNILKRQAAPDRKLVHRPARPAHPNQKVA